jgi:hypothetical protein
MGYSGEYETRLATDRRSENAEKHLKKKANCFGEEKHLLDRILSAVCESHIETRQIVYISQAYLTRDEAMYSRTRK